MNLEKKVKKLMEEGYKDSEKDEEKMLEVRRFYAEEHDWQINYARLHYECMFNLSRRQAEELNMDLWVYLSTKFKIPEEERYLIKPPNTLKNKKKEQDWIKKEFKPFFYEWKFNDFANPIIYAFSKDLLSLREGGNKTVATTKPRSDAKKDRIIKKRNEYLASGKFTRGKERSMNKIIAKVLKYNYNYVQDVLKLQRRNENTKC